MGKEKKNNSPIQIHLETYLPFFFSSPVNFGIFAPLVAQVGKDADVAGFLDAGYSIVLNDEPETIQWFAVKYDNNVEPTSSSTFAIFDTFTTEAGRKAHLDGAIPIALGANAPKLLVPEPPAISPVDVLASKVEKVESAKDKKAGLTIGIRVLIEAKPEKVQIVRDFLIVSVIMSHCRPW
jgi:hypothetical protein